jgi:hypothetical protein
VTSSFTKAETAAAMQSHKVSRKRYLHLVDWLKRWNVKYRDIQLNHAAVDELPEPEDGQGEKLCEWVDEGGRVWQEIGEQGRVQPHEASGGLKDL